MILYCAALLVGFLVLFKSADQFVIGSVATARNFSISPMVIGLTIVALGTSAPEIFVSTISSLQNEPEIAIGNAIGSNIANIGLVLGVTALIVPLKFRADILRNDMPIMVFVTLCAGATLIDFKLGIWDGLLLLLGLIIFLIRLATEQKKTTSVELVAEIEELGEIPPMSKLRSSLTFAVALIMLLISSELLVWSAVNIANALDVSELLIGLTVVAVGTSLPELVVSMTSALKNHSDMAIGNIVGSNIFNILAVLSIPCVLSPTTIDTELLIRDYGMMITLTILLVAFAYLSKPSTQKLSTSEPSISESSTAKKGGSISRVKGGVLLSLWLAYLGIIYLTSV